MKRFILLFAFVLIGAESFAQFRVGPLAGVSISRFIYEDDAFKGIYHSQYRPGYNLGLALNYKVTKFYSLQTELSFLKKSIDVRYEDEIVKVHNLAQFNYLSAPVLLRFSTHKNIQNQHIEFYVNVGPEINFWLGGGGVLKTTEQADFIGDNGLAYKVNFKENQGAEQLMLVEEPFRMQMSLGGGGGLIFDIGRVQNIAVDFRGSFGIGKSFHGKENGGQYGLELYSENLEGVHHTLSITASYLYTFDLNKFMRKGRSMR